jgi:hypothetical protein
MYERNVNGGSGKRERKIERVERKSTEKGEVNERKMER